MTFLVIISPPCSNTHVLVTSNSEVLDDVRMSLTLFLVTSSNSRIVTPDTLRSSTGQLLHCVHFALSPHKFIDITLCERATANIPLF